MIVEEGDEGNKRVLLCVSRDHGGDFGDGSASQDFPLARCHRCVGFEFHGEWNIQPRERGRVLSWVGVLLCRNDNRRVTFELDAGAFCVLEITARGGGDVALVWATHAGARLREGTSYRSAKAWSKENQCRAGTRLSSAMRPSRPSIAWSRSRSSPLSRHVLPDV